MDEHADDTAEDKGRKLMQMGELSRVSGLPPSTIKYYIKEGLIPSPRKLRYNVNLYDQAFVKRIIMIRAMQDEGLGLKSIKNILDRFSFEAISEWEAFKDRTRRKDDWLLDDEERLAVMSDEERRAQEILDAALITFSEKGYQKSSMDDVAREAGISKGTCYRYFESKEELFVATVSRTISGILAQLEAAAENAKGATTKLGIKGMAFIKNYKDAYFLLNDLVSEVVGGNRNLAGMTLELYDQVVRELAKDIEEGIREGTIRKVDSESVAYALISIIELAGRRHLVDPEFDALEFLIKLMDFIQHGISA